MKVGKKAYGTKGLIETHLASKSSPPTIDNSMDHVTRFVSRYSLIYGIPKLQMEFLSSHNCKVCTRGKFTQRNLSPYQRQFNLSVNWSKKVQRAPACNHRQYGLLYYLVKSTLLCLV